ncbi:MAG TPA: BNR-4 repeat-containing protein [bacterium]|nr:BNR-4 repeat-containing protein [bacterium]
MEKRRPFEHSMRFVLSAGLLCLVLSSLTKAGALLAAEAHGRESASAPLTLNIKDTGYRGIWYMNQPSEDEYVYKYSGGLGTYCANHAPFAVYCDRVHKTFFCYGGAAPDDDRRLWHMVSYYDHRTGVVPRPTVLLDKQTTDAHDNPVISVDGQGHVWIFSTSHGADRPSYIHRSKRPYDIDAFDLISAAFVQDGQTSAITNFSYMQPWHVTGKGFISFFTRYRDPANRTSFFSNSSDGILWSAPQRLAAIEEGHYQISAVGRHIAGAAFNYHPRGKGVNSRTNLYYMETPDWGRTWRAIDGTPLPLPVTGISNPSLVHDYRSDSLLVYLMQVVYDEADRPIILYLTSKGYASGPKNDPRTWMTARWTGAEWMFNPITVSDNNYDLGSLYLEAGGVWRLIAPTEPGPQRFNTGGEMVLWVSRNQGRSWEKERQMTAGSRFNHTFARAVVNAHPDFYAIWSDGHARRPSECRLYFCDREGRVFMLPRRMTGDQEKPVERKTGR